MQEKIADTVQGEKCKQTEIGLIPGEWEVVRLGDISSEMYYGITARATDKKSAFKMLRTTDIKNYKADWKMLPYCEITEIRRNLNKYFLKKKDLIITRAGTTGVSVLVDEDLTNIIFGSYLIKVKLKEGISTKFVHYFFQSNSYWKHITSSQSGVTLKNINLPILRSLVLPLPPLPEQHRIATVLSTIQRAIEQQDKIIETTKKLKKSLMHTLFTKGLNGEAQKETEIGRVPKSWEVVRLGDEDVADIIMGQSPPSITYNKEGIGLPFFQGKAEFGENYPTPIKWCLKPIKIAKEKDILVSVRAPVGDVNIALFECCIGRGLAAIRPKDNLEPVYLLYYLKTSKGRLEEEGGGTTFKAVGKSVLQNFKIPLPPLPEQQQIAHILSTVDNKIDVEERRKATLKELFKTMLHKLMTGEIRLKDVEL